MQTRLRESASYGFFAELFGGIDPVMIGLSPGFHLQVFFFGKREEAAVDAYMFMQATQHVGILDWLAQYMKGLQQHGLGVVMLRKCTCCADNLH